jgi:hypothetical protein
MQNRLRLTGTQTGKDITGTMGSYWKYVEVVILHFCFKKEKFLSGIDQYVGVAGKTTIKENRWEIKMTGSDERYSSGN